MIPFLTMFALDLIIFIVMKNLSTTLKRAFLISGLVIVAILLYKPVGAGESGTTLPTGGSNLSLSAGTELRIPLTPSLSLDLKLTTIDPSQTPSGEGRLYVPPIPMPRASEFGLDHYRFGAGLGFKF